MNFVQIYKAQGTGDRKSESLKITMELEFPQFQNIEISRENFAKDAKNLADALCDTLPGGTLDMLMVELLHRKASSFVVPLFSK